MKINWGTGIVLAFIGFISFIMYFVISMNINDKYDHDLVTDDYYKQELEFQNDIDKEKNANSLAENITWKKDEDGVVLNFPKLFEQDQVEGTVYFYRPSNKTFDFEIPIVLENYQIRIPKSKLLEGRWNIKVDWTYQNKSYLYKKEIAF